MRFERIEDAGGGKLFSRDDVNRRLSDDEAMSAGAFMARLWKLFGPASPLDGGFSYAIRDRETGLEFEAYSGASGPSYGGRDRDRERLKPVLQAFERLLDATEPAECRIEIGVDIDYGGGRAVLGWEDGKPFQRTVPRRHQPKKARTYQECVATAKEHEGGYGPEAGWHLCLQAVMPDPPARFTWKRHVITECLGFVLDRGEPAYTCLVGGSPREILLADVPIKKLPAIATLWLDSYARWRSRRSTQRANGPGRKTPRRPRSPRS